MDALLGMAGGYGQQNRAALHRLPLLRQPLPAGARHPAACSRCTTSTASRGGGFIAPMALAAIPEDKRPNACIGCRSCEAVCPQQIKISEAMADFSRMLNL